MTEKQVINKKTFWKISLGYKGSDWKNSLRDGEAAVGNFMTEGLSDIIKYSTPQDLQQRGMSSNATHQLWNFCNEIKIGDIIIPYAKNYIQGVGIVTSDFIFRSDTKYWEDEEYIRKVEWIRNMDEISIHNDPVLWIKAGKGPFTRNATLVKIKDNETERLIEILKENKVDIKSLLNA